MIRMTNVVIPLILTVASSFAMAEGGSERTLQRLDDRTGAKPTLKMLVKEGHILSIAPAGAAGTTDAIQNYRTNENVQPYVMKVEARDGSIHAVEFLSTPVGVNNG